MCVIAMVVHAHLVEAQVIKAGSPSCPAVALTYDLCPVRAAAGFDHELVDFLIMNKVPATFFMSGRWMARCCGRWMRKRGRGWGDGERPRSPLQPSD